MQYSSVLPSFKETVKTFSLYQGFKSKARTGEFEN